MLSQASCPAIRGYFVLAKEDLDWWPAVVSAAEEEEKTSGGDVNGPGVYELFSLKRRRKCGI